MRLDNGLFALDIPAGWAAEENEEGTTFLTNEQVDGLWVSIEMSGVRTDENPIDVREFVRKTFADKLALTGASETSGSDGRVVLRWREAVEHEGGRYLLHHGLAAWCQSSHNLQMLMFQAAIPEQLATTPLKPTKPKSWLGVPQLNCRSTRGSPKVRPNPSLDPTRYGELRKGGLWSSVHVHSPALRSLPPRLSQIERYAAMESLPFVFSDLC
jgi:hypothetical protein